MQGRDLDSVSLELADDRVHFRCDQDEVARGGHLRPHHLEVQGGRHAHARRDLHAVLLDPGRPWRRHLKDAAGQGTLPPHHRLDLVECGRLVRAGTRGWCGRSGKGCLRGIERGAQGLGEAPRRPVSAEVDVHHLRRFADEVVVDREHVEAPGLERPHDRVDLGGQENEVAHRHGLTLGPRLDESGPRAQGEGRLDRDAADCDAKVRAWPAVLAHVARKRLARAPQGLVHGLPGVGVRSADGRGRGQNGQDESEGNPTPECHPEPP